IRPSNDLMGEDCVFVPAGLPETAGFGAAFAPITLERGDKHD
ncbi:unnamed protein product, partial [marine sediment metagenome]